MTVPVVTLVLGSTTGTGAAPAAMGVAEPGSVKLVTVALVPGGAVTVSRMLPVAGMPGEVTTVGGFAAGGGADRRAGADQGKRKQ